MENSEIPNFRKEIRKLVSTKNISSLNKILYSDSYLGCNKDKIEKTIFQISNMLYTVSKLSINIDNKNTETLKYLIFEYKISEEASINQTSVSEEIKEMFEIRKFQEDLNQELDVKNKPSNKMKI